MCRKIQGLNRIADISELNRLRCLFLKFQIDRNILYNYQGNLYKGGKEDEKQKKLNFPEKD